jgi:hypothetical protein
MPVQRILPFVHALHVASPDEIHGAEVHLCIGLGIKVLELILVPVHVITCHYEISGSKNCKSCLWEGLSYNTCSWEYSWSSRLNYGLMRPQVKIGEEVLRGPLPHFSLASPGVFRFLQKVLGLNSAHSLDINWMILTRQQLTLYCKSDELKYGMQE